MTAQDVLKMAFDCGVLIQVKGDKLHLEAKEAPPNHLVAEIRHYKADLIALLAANDPVKNESYPPLEDGQLKRKSDDKQSPKNLGDALKTEQTTAPNIRDRFAPMAESSAVEQQSPFSLNNYSHCVTCNQCEHLSLTGTCSRLGKRVIAAALRECGSFQLLKKERPQIEEVKPYTQDELNKLLSQAAKPLYFHLIDCEQCSLEDARYCSDGMTLGSLFDDLLLCFDDAADKRYELMNQVIKARVSGRRAFESLFSDNAPLPRQDCIILAS